VSGNASFDRVSFEGAAGTDVIFNLDNGPMLDSATGVRFDLRDCRVRSIGNGFEVSFVHEATVRIGGPGHGNVFEGHSGAGLFYTLDASTVEYSHNRSATGYAGAVGLLIINDVGFFDYSAPTRVVVRENQIVISGETSAGIFAYDVERFFGTPTL